jgi:hypothetical protein
MGIISEFRFPEGLKRYVPVSTTELNLFQAYKLHLALKTASELIPECHYYGYSEDLNWAMVGIEKGSDEKKFTLRVRATIPDAKFSLKLLGGANRRETLLGPVTVSDRYAIPQDGHPTIRLTLRMEPIPNGDGTIFISNHTTPEQIPTEVLPAIISAVRQVLLYGSEDWGLIGHNLHVHLLDADTPPDGANPLAFHWLTGRLIEQALAAGRLASLTHMDGRYQTVWTQRRRPYVRAEQTSVGLQQNWLYRGQVTKQPLLWPELLNDYEQGHTDQLLIARRRGGRPWVFVNQVQVFDEFVAAFTSDIVVSPLIPNDFWRLTRPLAITQTAESMHGQVTLRAHFYPLPSVWRNAFEFTRLEEVPLEAYNMVHHLGMAALHNDNPMPIYGVGVRITTGKGYGRHLEIGYAQAINQMVAELHKSGLLQAMTPLAQWQVTAPLEFVDAAEATLQRLGLTPQRVLLHAGGMGWIGQARAAQVITLEQEMAYLSPHSPKVKLIWLGAVPYSAPPQNS